MIMGKEDYERIINKLRERAEKMEGVVNPLMTRLGVDYLGLVLPTVSAIMVQHDKLLREIDMLNAERDRMKEFVTKISKQGIPRPDYWSECWQCERNRDDAEELLEGKS